MPHAGTTTFEPTSKTSGFMLKAPEYGDKYVFTRVGVGEVDVYRYLRNDQTGGMADHQPHLRARGFLFLFGRTPSGWGRQTWLIFSASDQKQGHNTSGFEPDRDHNRAG